MSYYLKSQYVFLLLYETKTKMLEKKSRVIRRLLSIATHGPIIPFTLDLQTHGNLCDCRITAADENMVEILLTSDEGLMEDGIMKKKRDHEKERNVTWQKDEQEKTEGGSKPT